MFKKLYIWFARAKNFNAYVSGAFFGGINEGLEHAIDIINSDPKRVLNIEEIIKLLHNIKIPQAEEWREFYVTKFYGTTKIEDATNNRNDKSNRKRVGNSY